MDDRGGRSANSSGQGVGSADNTTSAVTRVGATNTTRTASGALVGSGSTGQSCTPSPLGYQCAVQAGAVTIHYSNGGPLPDNVCTQGTTSDPAVGSADGTGMMHFAAQATTPVRVCSFVLQCASSVQ